MVTAMAGQSIPPVPNRRVGTYLLTIFDIAEGPNDEVRSSTIARRLDVAPASVTAMIGRLEADGWVEHEPYGGVSLTDRGSTLARHLEWRRCVLATFFETVLDVHLSEDASYRVSFELPVDVVRRLGEVIEFPCQDVCGDRIWSDGEKRDEVVDSVSAEGLRAILETVDQ